jgi:protein-tyrosine phosphatase
MTGSASRGDDRRRTAPLDQADGTRPYQVDWIAGSDLYDGVPGRLGLTFLPGKHGVSARYPGLLYARDLDHDLAALRAAEVRMLLLLVEDHELQRWGDPTIVEAGRRHGIRIRRHPLPDGSAPASEGEMRLLIAELRAERALGDVAVACMGGVGRTGTVAACALVEGGMGADAAIRLVRRVRHPDAVETSEQRAFVERYAREHRGAARIDGNREGG